MGLFQPKKMDFTYLVITNRSEKEVYTEFRSYFSNNMNFQFSEYSEVQGLSFYIVEPPWMANSFIPVFYGTIRRKDDKTIQISGYFDYYKAVKVSLPLLMVGFTGVVITGFWMTWIVIPILLGGYSFTVLLLLWGTMASKSSKGEIIKYLTKICPMLY